MRLEVIKGGLSGKGGTDGSEQHVKTIADSPLLTAVNKGEYQGQSLQY